MLDLRGDDTHSNSPWDQLYNAGKFAMNTGNESVYGWAFGAYYEGVSSCNQVLENVPGIAMDSALKSRVLGQAYFLRGLYFYHLVNFFGNVALPTSTTVRYNKQHTEAEGWAQVISDFQLASKLLPVSYKTITGVDAGQIGRATKGATLAFLGKSYLFNQKFDSAATCFKSVIDLGVYSLVANYADNFTTNNENNSESIFEVQFSRDAGGTDLGWGGIPSSSWGNTSARAITYAPRGFGWTDVQPTRALLNEFQQEKTAKNQEDPRLTATLFYNKPGLKLYGQLFSTVYASNSADLNDVFCAKYENSDGTFPNEYDWRSGINERIMRYADVLMMYAECLNEVGNTAAAYPYIQQVRARAGLANLSTVKPSMTQAQMRDQISHERYLEFALEGHRFDDIRRWGWLQNPDKLAFLQSRDDEFNTYQPGRELYPIPQSGEIDANLGFKQNPGY
jgi:tetratricopeptide (TPR) repeat protein